MSKHRAPRRAGLFARVIAPFVAMRAFQDRLDREVAAVLNKAGVAVGGVRLTVIVRGDDLPLLSLAAEVMQEGGVPSLLDGRGPDELAMVARSIKRVHRLSLSRAYEMA